jgi:hypothetical protein
VEIALPVVSSALQKHPVNVPQAANVVAAVTHSAVHSMSVPIMPAAAPDEATQTVVVSIGPEGNAFVEETPEDTADETPVVSTDEPVDKAPDDAADEAPDAAEGLEGTADDAFAEDAAGDAVDDSADVAPDDTADDDVANTPEDTPEDTADDSLEDAIEIVPEPTAAADDGPEETLDKA